MYVRTLASEVIGYYTLSMSSIEPSNDPDEPPLGPRRVPVPASLIGRLAADVHHQGTGLGQDLLLDAIRRAVLASVGAIVIRVDVLNDAAASFYAHHGFRPIRAGGREMYLPMQTAQRTRTVTSFILNAARLRAETVLEPTDGLVLTNEDFRRLLDEVESSPDVSEALRRAIGKATKRGLAPSA